MGHPPYGTRNAAETGRGEGMRCHPRESDVTAGRTYGSLEEALRAIDQTNPGPRRERDRQSGAC